MALDVAKGAAAVLLALGHAGGATARRGSPARPRSSATSIRSGCGSTAARASRSRRACSRCWRRSRPASPAALFLVTVWAHPVRVARIDRRDGGAAAGGLAHRRAARRSSPRRRGTGALILFRHRANIRRLRAGTERRMGARAMSGRCARSCSAIGTRSPCSAPAAGAPRWPCTSRATGHDVRLWARDPALVERDRADARQPALPAGRRHSRPGVTPTAALGDALDGAPYRRVSRCRRTACAPSCAPRRRSSTPAAVLVSATKGLEAESLRADVAGDRARRPRRAVPVVVLSGPSFAVEVARGLPTAVLAASPMPARRRACRSTSAARPSGSTRATTWSASRSAAR